MTVTELAPPQTLPPEQRSPREKQEPRLQIALVGLDENVRNYAMEAAHASLETTLAKRGVRGFLARVFKGNLMRGHFLLKHTLEAQRTLEEHNNLLHFHGVSADAYERPVLDRFTRTDDEMLYKAAGETRVNLREADNSSTSLYQDITLLLKAHLSGKDARLNDREKFEKAVQTIVRKHSWKKNIRQYLGKGKLQVNNLWDVAQTLHAKMQEKHQAGEDLDLDALLHNADFYVGKGRVGPRTSFSYSKMERVVRKLEGRGGFGLHEASVISAATLACSIGGLALQRSVGIATAMLPGAAAGLWAGLRERRIMDDERTMRQRDIAIGSDVTAGKSDYTAVYAMEMAETIAEFYNSPTNALYFDSREDYVRFLKILVHTENRLLLSDEKGIDLVKGSSSARLDEERDVLRYAIHAAKHDLYQWLAETDPDILQNHFGLKGREIERIRQEGMKGVESQLEIAQYQRTRLEYDIKERDRRYDWEKVGRELKVGLAVGGLALAGGVVAQEALAYVIPGRQGVFEAAKPNDRMQTFLATIFNRDNHGVVTASSGNHVATMNNSMLSVPDAFTVENNDGALTINGPKNTHLDSLTYDSDGKLSDESLQQLTDAGFKVDAQTITTGGKETVTKELTPAQFIAQNPKASAKTIIDFYYTNNTPTADGNETKLRYGGIDRAGNYVIQVNAMDRYGSTQGNNYLDWRAAAERRNLWVGLTASDDTRGQTFLTPVDPETGQALIVKGTPEAALFEKGSNGPIFHGYRMQVLEGGGRDNGTLHVRPLATQLGSNDATFTAQTEVDTTKTSYSYVLNHPEMKNTSSVAPADAMNVLPVIPPVLPRGTVTPPAANDDTTEEPDPPLGNHHAPADYPSSPEGTLPQQVSSPPYDYAAPATDTESEEEEAPREVREVPPLQPSSPAPRHARPEDKGLYTPSAIAQAYYERMRAAGVSTEEAQERLGKLLKRAGLRRGEFTFSSNGNNVIVLRDVRLGRHAVIPPASKKKIPSQYTYRPATTRAA